MSLMHAKERLFLTADQTKLVREGDPEGATLYVAPGDQIPESAVARFGLVDGTIPDQGDGGGKEKSPSPNKEKKPGGDKGAGGGTKGAAVDPGTITPAGDDLTQVKHVGPASATALAAAGITSFAQIAAIDPANPPAVEGLGVRTNWAGMVEAAKALLPATESDQGDASANGDGEAGTGDADQGGN